MIRQFTILCKLHHISLSDRQWLQKERESFAVYSQVCPGCQAKGCLTGYGHYDRYLVEFRENHCITTSITVQRYRCSSCGHTHALLSSCLVPCRSYSLRFILHALRCYFLRRMTVEQLCICFEISPATLYSWKALFQKQKSLWLGVLENLAQDCNTFLDRIDGGFLKEFQHTFCFSFLEHLPRRARELPFPKKEKPPAITGY